MIGITTEQFKLTDSTFTQWVFISTWGILWQRGLRGMARILINRMAQDLIWLAQGHPVIQKTTFYEDPELQEALTLEHLDLIL